MNAQRPLSIDSNHTNLGTPPAQSAARFFDDQFEQGETRRFSCKIHEEVGISSLYELKTS